MNLSHFCSWQLHKDTFLLSLDCFKQLLRLKTPKCVHNAQGFSYICRDQESKYRIELLERKDPHVRYLEVIDAVVGPLHDDISPGDWSSDAGAFLRPCQRRITRVEAESGAGHDVGSNSLRHALVADVELHVANPRLGDRVRSGVRDIVPGGGRDEGRLVQLDCVRERKEGRYIPEVVSAKRVERLEERRNANLLGTSCRCRRRPPEWEILSRLLLGMLESGWCKFWSGSGSRLRR